MRKVRLPAHAFMISVMMIAALTLGALIASCASAELASGTSAAPPSSGSPATPSTTAETFPAAASTAPVTSESADVTTATSGSSDAEILASAVRMLEQVPYWSYEPKGDITQDSTQSPFWGELIWAAVSSVSPDGSQITFDAAQFYKTGYGAEEEARKDKAEFYSEHLSYGRNACEYVQTLPLAPDATIVLDRSAVGDYPGVQSLGSDELALVSVTPQQFAGLFRDDPEFPTLEEGVGLWLVISDGVVTKIFDPYKC